MRLREVMTRAVTVVHPEATIVEAAQTMRVFDIGPVPVCDGERLLGIVTDRDITIRATALGSDPHVTRVREVMTAAAVFCFEDQEVEEAAHVMEEHRIRRLLVLNREHHLVGVVSLGDLALHVPHASLAGAVLEELSRPAPSL